MGLGKTIRGVGTAELYHPEPEVFLQRVSDTFHVNVSEFYKDGDEQNLTCATLEYSESISVHASHSKRKKPLVYDFKLPIHHYSEKTLDFSFYPNHIFEFDHIPYNSAAWYFFIQDLSGAYCDVNDMIPSYLEVQRLYVPLVQKLACKKIIITTDGNYLWEDELIFSENYKQVYTIDALIKKISELDGIRYFSLQDIFSMNHTDEVKKIYEEKSYFEIAFIDTIINQRT